MSYVEAGYTVVLTTLALFATSVVWRERVARTRARTRTRTRALTRAGSGQGRQP